jgi:hypothetical protein
MVLEAGLVQPFKLEQKHFHSSSEAVLRLELQGRGLQATYKGLQALRTTPLRLDLEKQCTLLHTGD